MAATHGAMTVARAPRSLLLEMPERAERFCWREGLQDALAQALRLAERYFPGISPGDIDVVRDPDSGDEWLSVRVHILQEPSQEDFLDRWDAYADAWVDAVTESAADKIRVSFSRV